MRGMLKTLIFLGVGALTASPIIVYAQTEDIAVFDNETNDFLLPSYFDTPPAMPSQEPTSPAMSSQDLMPPANIPQNVPSDVDILAEIFGDQNVSSGAPAPQTTSTPTQMGHTQVFYPTPKSVATANAERQPLLTPLAPLPAVPDSAPQPPRNFAHTSTYATDVYAQEKGTGQANITLPKDIRLQFLPGRTQLTQSAIKWISAYAMHVRKVPRLVLALRVSNKDWPVQQTRLGLIMQVLFERGLSTRQLQIFQSDRDPDTIVIGSDNNSTQTQIIVPGETKKTIRQQKTLLW